MLRSEFKRGLGHPATCVGEIDGLRGLLRPGLLDQLHPQGWNCGNARYLVSRAQANDFIGHEVVDQHHMGSSTNPVVNWLNPASKLSGSTERIHIRWAVLQVRTDAFSANQEVAMGDDNSLWLSSATRCVEDCGDISIYHPIFWHLEACRAPRQLIPSQHRYAGKGSCRLRSRNDDELEGRAGSQLLPKQLQALRSRDEHPATAVVENVGNLLLAQDGVDWNKHSRCRRHSEMQLTFSIRFSR